MVWANHRQEEDNNEMDGPLLAVSELAGLWGQKPKMGALYCLDLNARR